MWSVTHDRFTEEPVFLLRPHWSCVVLKGPASLQGKSSGTAKGPFNVVSTLRVKYRTTPTPLLTYEIRLPCALHLNASNWNVADWKALKQVQRLRGKWVILQEEQLSWLRSWTSGCTWENGLVWIFCLGCTAASIHTLYGKRVKSVSLRKLRMRITYLATCPQCLPVSLSLWLHWPHK